MINGAILNINGISFTAGLERFMDDEELYEEVLTAFVGEDILERAEAAYAARDNAGLLAAVHEAKGSCGNAGLDRLYNEANTLVKLLRSASFTEDELAMCYSLFAKEYSTARTGIKAALGI